MTGSTTSTTNTEGSVTTFYRKGDFPRQLTGTSTGHEVVDDFLRATFETTTGTRRFRDSTEVKLRIEEKFDALTSSLGTDERLSSIEPGKVREYLSWLRQSPTIREGLKLLEGDLAGRADLHYHNPSHTWDVLREFSMIALREGLSTEELKLGAVASVFHDLGFLKQKPKNEPFGSACLVHFHDSFQREFSDTDSSRLNNVVQAILDTRPRPVEGKTAVFVPQLTHGPHERVASCLLDADVANFGRADFLEKATKVFAEIRGFAVVPTVEQMAAAPEGRQFLTGTLGMLRAHTFWNASAREIFDQGKAQNIVRIETLLERSALAA